MSKRLSGSIAFSEEKELEDLLFENPELWYSYELLQAVMSLDEVPAEFINEINSLLNSQFAVEKFNALLKEQLDATPQDHKKSFLLSYKKVLLPVALTLLIACIGWLFSDYNSPVAPKKQYYATNEIVASKGSKTKITLADGSQIWLNAGSKLVYAKDFSLENREVFLTGEAYFKVIHDDKHAFIVHTPLATIRDLGTTFNVKAYPGSETTETTLIEGSVEIILKSNSLQKILIQPNEKVVLYNPLIGETHASTGELEAPLFEVSKIVPYSTTNDIIEIAWLSDKLIFRDRSFEDLITEMERRYNVSITIQSEALKKKHFTGIFRNESIGEALKFLQEIVPFKLTIDNDKILINE